MEMATLLILPVQSLQRHIANSKFFKNTKKMDGFSCVAIQVILLISGMEFSARAAAKETIPANLAAAVKSVNADRFSNQGWSKDIATFVPPEEMVRELPQYIMGYDFEKRPVFVVEFGKWDTKKFVEKDKKTRDLYNKYGEKFWFYCANYTSPFPDALDETIIIIDLKGLQVRQLASFEVLKSQLYHARLTEKVEPRAARIFFINMSFVAETWVNIIRPVAGKVVGKAELIGQDQSKIAAILKEIIPRDQLPEWYGGTKDFKPVQILG